MVIILKYCFTEENTEIEDVSQIIQELTRVATSKVSCLDFSQIFNLKSPSLQKQYIDKQK